MFIAVFRPIEGASCAIKDIKTAHISNRLPPAGGGLSPRTPEGANASVCGSEASPWVVGARPGQGLNVTLLDFTVNPARR